MVLLASWLSVAGCVAAVARVATRGGVALGGPNWGHRVVAVSLRGPSLGVSIHIVTEITSLFSAAVSL